MERQSRRGATHTVRYRTRLRTSPRALVHGRHPGPVNSGFVSYKLLHYYASCPQIHFTDVERQGCSLDSQGFMVAAQGTSCTNNKIHKPARPVWLRG